MKILKLAISGARLIKAALFEFKPVGLTEIKGKNKQGKTTVIDVLCGAFLGKAELHPRMISSGEEVMKIKVTTDEDLEIRRSYSETSDVLTVSKIVGENAVKIPSPQKFLDELISWIALRPQEFVNADAATKKKMLMKEIGIDFTEIDKKIKTKEEDRTLKGREVKAFGNPVLPEIPEGLKRVDVVDLNNQKNVIIEENKLKTSAYNKSLEIVAENQREFNAIIDFFNKLRDNAIDLKDSMKALPENVKEVVRDKGFDSIRDAIKVLIHEEPKPTVELPVPAPPELRDTSHIDEKINNADQINRMFDNFDKITLELRAIEKAQKEYESLTEEIATLRQQKQKMLEDADIGIKDLVIDEQGIFVNGIFSEDWSGMEGIKYAVQFGLKRSKLRVVAIDGFELFDNDSRNDFIKFCEDNDIQAIVTTVSSEYSDGDDAYYIEAGTIISGGEPNDNNDQKSFQVDDDDF